MRKIITTTMLTLDGVMQAPGGSKEDESEGFKYGGWATSWGEEEDYITKKMQGTSFDLLFGRKTYDIFAGYWPKHTDEKHWGNPFDSDSSCYELMLICATSEHTHTFPSCYGKVLTCTQNHAHDETACYDLQIVCSQNEHTHSFPSCYGRVLVCGYS